MKTIAIILAAGNGSRFEKQTPKQYTQVHGETILNKAIKAFLSVEKIDAIQVVISDSHIPLYKSTVLDHKKLLPYCIGGDTRKDSSYLGLKAIEHLSPLKVLIHDAARPYVTKNIITQVIEKLSEYDAVDVGAPVTDTIKQLSSLDKPLKISSLKRDTLYATQTPQGFIYKHILSEHEKLNHTHITDDISLMLQKDYKVGLVEGIQENLKITYKCDIENIMRIGTGFDTHKFDDKEGINYIMLCGIKIPHTHKIIAHSDGDVALHALTDALLGAIACGDIGDHFPPTDAKWKNADSASFLMHANSLVKQQKGCIQNIDITIIAQKPQISPYKEVMRQRVAEILEISISQVSVKATTTEGLGFTGRKEGIAAQASCIISF